MTVDPGWRESRSWLTPGRPEHGGYIGPRTKLLTAGQELLFERGDTSYTMEDLARRSGVAIKIFYRCYANKEEFLQEVFTVSVNGAVPRMREHILATTDDPLARLRMAVTWPLNLDQLTDPTDRAIACEHIRLTMTSPETVAAAQNPYEELLQELITHAAAAGLVSPVDPGWDAHLIRSLITASYHALIFGLGQPDPAALADNVWRFCLSALHGSGSVSHRGRRRARRG